MSPIFYQDTREKAIDILSFIYEAWLSVWQETRSSLGELNLSEAASRRLNFCDNEQRRAVVSHLAKLLVAWESSDHASFSTSVNDLAHELRPTLASPDAEESTALTPAQLATLRRHLSRISHILKDSISELAQLTPVPDPSKKSLTVETAESLLRERLGLSFFDFLEFSEEPEFHSGYFPALLQDSVDQGF